jgi:hypothetical protein
LNFGAPGAVRDSSAYDLEADLTTGTGRIWQSDLQTGLFILSDPNMKEAGASIMISIIILLYYYIVAKIKCAVALNTPVGVR